MAHELAHIRNNDILVMTVAVATAGSIAIISDVFWRMLYFGMPWAGRGRCLAPAEQQPGWRRWR